MSNSLEQVFARLPKNMPRLEIPPIPRLPTIPLIGCLPGDGKTVIGKKYGNRPDLLKLANIRQYKKDILEKIALNEIAELDNPFRTTALRLLKAKWLIEKIQIANEWAKEVADFTEEINQAIQLAQQQIDQLNGLIQEISNTPAEQRSKIEAKLLERYNEYLGEQEAKANGLRTVLGCLGAF